MLTSGGFKASPPPFPPEVYHQMIVKLEDLRPKILEFFRYFRRWAPIPPFSKFLDPPLLTTGDHLVIIKIKCTQTGLDILLEDNLPPIDIMAC
jgi:hypothetical protein